MVELQSLDFTHYAYLKLLFTQLPSAETMKDIDLSVAMGPQGCGSLAADTIPFVRSRFLLK